jgi:hypothetical protein
MRNNITLKEIENGIEKLESQEQLRLMEKLIHLLVKNNLNMKKELNWDELYGLGKGLWNGEDAQDYVSRYRE